jgi:hypothetical protein
MPLKTWLRRPTAIRHDANRSPCKAWPLGPKRVQHLGRRLADRDYIDGRCPRQRLRRQSPTKTASYHPPRIRAGERRLRESQKMRPKP